MACAYSWTSCRIGFAHPCACRGQAIKEIVSTSHLKVNFQMTGGDISLSLLSDSNQRPRDYKSRALANGAKEAGGQAYYIAPLQPAALAAVKPWGIHREHAV